MTTPGRYQHYKGHLYEVLGHAKHSETTEVLGIAYLRLDAPEPVVWVRPEAMFDESVVVEGTPRPRFSKVSSETLQGERLDCAENHYTAEEGRALEARIRDLEQQLRARVEWTSDDKPIPEDAKIHAAHPTETDEHGLYMEAFRMVSAKNSKFALVDLVNWLLARLKVAEGRSERR